MPDTSVKVFRSTDTSAPTLANTAGSLITLLDACLVNGYGSVTLSSLAVSSNVATATVAAGHGFTMIGNTGPVIKIEGAAPSGLNGEWRITVTTSTAFTFATTGISDQTATGTITAKRAPAGFAKAFSGTNKAAYRSNDITGSRLFLRIDDGYTTYSRIRGYESMDDVDTVTPGYGVFPTDAQISGGAYMYKDSGSGNRAWTLVSDERIVYFFCDATGSSQFVGGFVFGDVLSYKASDAFGCALIASGSASGTHVLYVVASASSSSCIARSYTQLGMSILSSRYSHGKITGGLGSGGSVYPCPVDDNIHMWPVECWESTTIPRGLMPGLWCPLHGTDVIHGLIVEDIPQLPGRSLLVHVTGGSSYRCALDITGPWR
jgi:hypothetical protein